MADTKSGTTNDLMDFQEESSEPVRTTTTIMSQDNKSGFGTKSKSGGFTTSPPNFGGAECGALPESGCG